MGEAAVTTDDGPRLLIDALAAAQQTLAAAQARQAGLMLEFDAARQHGDRRRIAGKAAVGADARYEPGEFAAMEIGLAIKASKHSVQRTIGVAHRLREETPDAWQAWLAGDIDHLRAAKINHALLRLTRASSKQLLNALVVPVAACKTAELLGRWLNAFIATYEPDETDERLRRSLADRYVSLRPDLDGVSFLSAALSALDAAAIDQVLNALAGLCEPGDPRTLQQRRADALVDMLLGRVSNGCHVTWNDTDEALASEQPDGDDDNSNEPKTPTTEQPASEEPRCGEKAARRRRRSPAMAVRTAAVIRAPTSSPGRGNRTPISTCPHRRSAPTPAPPTPAATFPIRAANRQKARSGRPGSCRTRTGPAGRSSRPAPGNTPARPLPVTIGVVVSIQSLFGYTNTPGQLADRSALVPADTIRALAQQPETLFYRLLTDQHGNLLETTELGRFPSRKLGNAITFRDGSCANPVCTVPAHRCDLDHIVPVPHGPTTADNIEPKCRTDHRAKTHAGHRTTRTQTATGTPHATQWTTPTGHTYTTPDDPFPVENWPPAGGAATPNPVLDEPDNEPPSH